MRTHPIAVALAALLSLGAPLLLGGCSKSETPASSTTAEARTHSSKGSIKNFGPDRKFVSIAHEAIPNYMAAMTMSFEPRTPTQLDGLQAGDKVEFSFEDAASGKRILSSIKKSP